MAKYSGFSQVQLTKPRKSQFDLSHQVRMSTRMGRLTPVFISEAVPSDVFNGSSEILLRLAPLLAPIYDQIQLYVHFFFVPNRLLWEEWETFITGGRLGVEANPGDAPLPPYADIGAMIAEGWCDKSSLADYLGVPIFADIDPGDYTGKYLDLMPFAAFQQCYMDYYRDRNFVPDELLELPLPLPSGLVAVATSGELFQLRNRSYEHDYFTSALPFTQRGSEVLMPVGGNASVSYLDQSLIKDVFGNPIVTAGALGGAPSGPGNLRAAKTTIAGEDGTSARIENIDEIIFDSSTVGINDFRSAFALQVWLERNAIGGSRYNESTQAHFGVRPQDSRLQRAEYLGGGRIPVKISEVVSTAYSDDGVGTVPLANLAGHGITYGNTNRFHYFVPEHGFIIGIASIMCPPSYHQGLPRMFRRRTFLDYPWPTFANLGEQQVDKAELFANRANLTENADGILPLFGYQSRYADWKYVCSRNAGEFHDTLLFWTLTRDFADSPELSQAFNEFEDGTQDRIFAVSGADNFWLYIHNKITVKRPLPYFGKPNTLGFGS